MPVSPNEAADRLRAISTTELASSTAFQYARAAPHLILWGAIWFVGYGVTYLSAEWSAIWIPLVIVGSVASGWLGARDKTAAHRPNWRQSAAVAAAILASLGALFAILPPLGGLRMGAFFPIVLGFGYMLVGIRNRALRLLVTGVALTALTLIGFFWLPSYFPMWMAIVGGGGLALGGFWLRSL
ncbi:MAG TPA: hypothetical protein VL131_15650 [Gammaproteobacteria bacterium]|nr:hypothetical protein [Gammaproteobacteria bacterium]